MKGLNLERLCLAAQACGNMHFAIEYAKAFAVERVQFGQPISKFQAIQHKFADMRILLKTTQALTYRLADMLDAGLDPVEETAIAKIQGTDGEFKCAHLAMEIMGGAGYTMAHDIQRLFRDVRVGSIGGGTRHPAQHDCQDDGALDVPTEGRGVMVKGSSDPIVTRVLQATRART